MESGCHHDDGFNAAAAFRELTAAAAVVIPLGCQCPMMYPYVSTLSYSPTNDLSRLILSISACPYFYLLGLYLSLAVFLYLFLSLCIFLFLSLCVYLSLFLSLFFSPFPSISVSFYLYSFVSVSFYLYPLLSVFFISIPVMFKTVNVVIVIVNGKFVRRYSIAKHRALAYSRWLHGNQSPVARETKDCRRRQR